VKVAYADPPYPGQAKKRYEDHEDYGGEVDHAALVRFLEREYDAWALSTASSTLRQVLPLCPEDVRIGAWVKPFAAYKKNIWCAYAWEPVILKPASRRGSTVVCRDFVAEPITMKKGLTGAKPERFCFWLFNVLGAAPEDEFYDLFPGSGMVSDAWRKWKREGGPKLKQQIKVESTLEAPCLI
jgi:hypothetical protein